MAYLTIPGAAHGDLEQFTKLCPTALLPWEQVPPSRRPSRSAVESNVPLYTSLCSKPKRCRFPICNDFFQLVATSATGGLLPLVILAVTGRSLVVVVVGIRVRRRLREHRLLSGRPRANRSILHGV